MNVIISNKNRDILSNLNVEVIKTMNGEFSTDEIINIFSNMFYNKMFLDISSIKNYKDVKEIQKLVLSLDANKIVLLLENNDICNSSLFQSKLVNMGIYNFTFNLEGLNYLSIHTNAYRDVAHLQEVIIDETNGSGNSSKSIINSNSSNNIINQINSNNLEKKIFVLGLKNITSHAGSTTLIYMLKQQLSKFYSVVAIEVNRRDFIYFKDEDMISIRDNQLEDTIKKYSDRDIILLDLNDCNYEMKCDDVLYLIEPSILKLNKMIMINRNIFQKLCNKKIVLNKSMLNDKDIRDFERESSSEVFYSIPPLNDRLNNSEVLLPMLDKMNLISVKSEKDDNKSRKLFKF